jgi:hypothetical protein
MTADDALVRKLAGTAFDILRLADLALPAKP